MTDQLGGRVTLRPAPRTNFARADLELAFSEARWLVLVVIDGVSIASVDVGPVQELLGNPQPLVGDAALVAAATLLANGSDDDLVKRVVDLARELEIERIGGIKWRSRGRSAAGAQRERPSSS